MLLAPMRRLILAAPLVALMALPAAAQTQTATFPQAVRIGVVPPTGMVASQKFSGFEDAERRSSILIVEMPDEAYGEIEKRFTAETLRQQGLAVETREAVTVKGGKGILIGAKQMAGGLLVHRQILLANAGGVTAMVNSAVPDNATQTYTPAAMRAALLSMAVRGPVPEQEKLASMPFVLRDLAGMRVANIFAGSAAILTDGPKDQVEGSEQPVFVVAASIGEAPADDQRGNFSQRLLATIPGLKEVRITRAEPMRLDNQPAFEIMATAKDAQSNADVTVIQWVRFASAGYVRFVGISRTGDWERMYPRFRMVRDGIGPKS
jgi:hypothetical protein